jgi:hypothetical protein
MKILGKCDFTRRLHESRNPFQHEWPKHAT